MRVPALKLTFIPPSARAILLKSPTQSLELVGRGVTAKASIIPVAKPALVSKRTRTRGKVLAKFSCISLRNANFSFVAVSVGATSPSHFAEGRHLQPRGTHWRGVAKPALISKPADAAARKHGARALMRGARGRLAAAKAAFGGPHVGLLRPPLGHEERVHQECGAQNDESHSIATVPRPHNQCQGERENSGRTVLARTVLPENNA